MVQERRKHKRAKKHLCVKIADKNFDIITETADISPQGTYCRVTRMLPLMSKIELMLLVPSRENGNNTKKIKCKGVVVRSDPCILENVDKAHYNVAIFFTNVSKKDRKIIESYVNSTSIDQEQKEVKETWK